jgi:hypothetical protein
MKNSKGPQTQPTVNYVRGRIIDILFEDRKVSTVTVIDKATGVMIEPAVESAANTPAAKTPATPGTQPAQRPAARPPVIRR